MLCPAPGMLTCLARGRLATRSSAAAWGNKEPSVWIGRDEQSRADDLGHDPFDRFDIVHEPFLEHREAHLLLGLRPGEPLGFGPGGVLLRD